MFENAKQQIMDPILSLMSNFRADSRPSKINLGIGVYKDDSGCTPVFEAVKLAEQQILNTQTTKEYVSVSGDEEFLKRLALLIFPSMNYGNSVRGIQTVGGSGAIRLLLEAAQNISNPKVWMPSPTWPNHYGVARACGLATSSYHYLNDSDSAVNIAKTIASLDRAEPGDIVVIHLSCHNPTGVDFTDLDINIIADYIQHKGLIPLIDAAYIGFGDTIDQDIERLRRYIDVIPEAMIALSFSKNFGLYRERTGAAFITGSNVTALHRAMETIFVIARGSYSMPPDHGSRIVRTVLESDTLSTLWKNELALQRNRIITKRQILATALTERKSSFDWSYIGRGSGMFSLIKIDPINVEHMKVEDGVYIMPNGRINIAGVIPNKVDYIADAIVRWL